MSLASKLQKTKDNLVNMEFSSLYVRVETAKGETGVFPNHLMNL